MLRALLETNIIDEQGEKKTNHQWKISENDAYYEQLKRFELWTIVFVECLALH